MPSAPKSTSPPAFRVPFRADVLSEVLNSIRLHCFVPGPSEMTAPWGIAFGTPPNDEVQRHLETVGLVFPPSEQKRPPAQGAFYAITRGTCWLTEPRHGINLELSAGDVVVLTRAGPTILRDQLATEPQNVLSLLGPQHRERLAGLRAGGGGASTAFMHGVYFYADEQDDPLLAALPPIIHLRGEGGHAVPLLEDTVKHLAREAMNQQPGWHNVVAHLAEVLFAQAVRAHFAASPGTDRDATDGGAAGWSRALADRDLSAALGAIHAQPSEPWTVASLAQRASMSRSAFAARFTTAVGQSPMQYLTQFRMRRAKELLRDGRLPIKTLAARVGYANESAFSNAFKRIVGVAPAGYRKQRD